MAMYMARAAIIISTAAPWYRPVEVPVPSCITAQTGRRVTG